MGIFFGLFYSWTTGLTITCHVPLQKREARPLPDLVSNLPALLKLHLPWEPYAFRTIYHVWTCSRSLCLKSFSEFCLVRKWKSEDQKENLLKGAEFHSSSFCICICSLTCVTRNFRTSPPLCTFMPHRGDQLEEIKLLSKFPLNWLR